MGDTVRLFEIIRAPKTNIKIGQWKSGKVPKADYPIARSAYKLGNSFRWLVIQFEALGAECRVLVVMNAGKQKYEAILSVMGDDGTLRVLCSYEHHASEPGWHCHATHDEVAKLPGGVMRGPWVRRIPGAKKHHNLGKLPKKSNVFDGDDKKAIQFAQDRFRIFEKGSLV